MADLPIQRTSRSTGPNRRNRPTDAPAPGRRYATLQAAADYAGVKNPRTVREWISSGLINGYMINKRVLRVDLNEIDAAMQPVGGGGAA